MHDDQQALEEYALALRHLSEDSMHTSTISDGINLCQDRILEGEVREVLTMVINEVVDRSSEQYEML